jgi:hypothetical protein
VQAAQQQTAQQRGKADIRTTVFSNQDIATAKPCSDQSKAAMVGLPQQKTMAPCNHAPACQAAYTFCYIFL